MRLSEYLSMRGLTQTAFAAQIGTSVETVSRYLKGTRWPRPLVMGCIVRETKGLVGPDDFLPEYDTLGQDICEVASLIRQMSVDDRRLVVKIARSLQSRDTQGRNTSRNPSDLESPER